MHAGVTYHANLLLHVGLVGKLGKRALHLQTVTFLHIPPCLLYYPGEPLLKPSVECQAVLWWHKAGQDRHADTQTTVQGCRWYELLALADVKNIHTRLHERAPHNCLRFPSYTKASYLS